VPGLSSRAITTATEDTVANCALKTFSAEVDSADDETLQEMLRGLSAYVDYNASRPPAFDDEPRMRPMQGTHMDDFIQDNKSSAADPLNFWSDDESDGQDALESLQHLTAFWAPRNGDIKILPPLYAQQITLLTGTSIFFEEAEKRCRLFQGDFRLALDKLLRLEPLLVCDHSSIPPFIDELTASGNLQETTPRAVPHGQRKPARLAAQSERCPNRVRQYASIPSLIPSRYRQQSGAIPL
jgi:hypothetical protein